MCKKHIITNTKTILILWFMPMAGGGADKHAIPGLYVQKDEIVDLHKYHSCLDTRTVHIRDSTHKGQYTEETVHIRDSEHKRQYT